MAGRRDRHTRIFRLGLPPPSSAGFERCRRSSSPAVAFLPVLDPEQVRTLLQDRITALDEKLAGVVAQAPPGLPRLFLVEDEYRAAMLRAELAWVRGLVADLAEGRLTWDAEMIQATLAEFG